MPNSVASLVLFTLIMGHKGPAIADAFLAGGDQDPEKALIAFKKDNITRAQLFGLSSPVGSHQVLNF